MGAEVVDRCGAAGAAGSAGAWGVPGSAGAGAGAGAGSAVSPGSGWVAAAVVSSGVLVVVSFTVVEVDVDVASVSVSDLLQPANTATRVTARAIDATRPTRSRVRVSDGRDGVSIPYILARKVWQPTSGIRCHTSDR